MAHHRRWCWCLIHGELSHLASPKWRFICINGEKCFRTIWKEWAEEFQRSLIIARSKRFGTRQEKGKWSILQPRWKKWKERKGFPTNRLHQTDYGIKDRTALHSKCPRKPKRAWSVRWNSSACPTLDVTNRYVVRAKRVAEEQYDSLRFALSKTM